MAEHQRLDPGKTEEPEEVRRRKKKVQPLSDRVKTPDAGVKPQADLIGMPSVEAHATMLGRVTSTEQGADMITRLQQAYGNAYVQRVIEGIQAEKRSGQLLAPETWGMPLQTSPDSIRVVNLADGIGMLLDINATMDGKEAVPEEGAKEKEQELNPVELPLGGPVGTEDAISGQIGVFYTIRPGKLALGQAFGMAEYLPSWKTWVRPRRSPGATGTRYEVKTRVAVKYTWDVDPHGRKHIGGPHDPDVTKESWSQIMEDLTPGPGVPCRSPRMKYWCKDLTIKHEQFHIQDWIGAFRDYRPTAEALLNGQSASSREDALSKADDAISNMITDVNSYMGSGNSCDAEVRAYAEGEQSYRARTAGVRGRAAAEKWPQGTALAYGQGFK